MLLNLTRYDLDEHKRPISLLSEAVESISDRGYVRMKSGAEWRLDENSITRLKAAIQLEQQAPAPVEWVNEDLPPAKPVAAGRQDLVLAVRNLHLNRGKVDEGALFRFIVDVLGDQKPESSPSPKPLIDALEYLAKGATSDNFAYNLARQALEAYNTNTPFTIIDPVTQQGTAES